MRQAGNLVSHFTRSFGTADERRGAPRTFAAGFTSFAGANETRFVVPKEDWNLKHAPRAGVVALKGCAADFSQTLPAPVVNPSEQGRLQEGGPDPSWRPPAARYDDLTPVPVAQWIER